MHLVERQKGLLPATEGDVDVDAAASGLDATHERPCFRCKAPAWDVVIQCASCDAPYCDDCKDSGVPRGISCACGAFVCGDCADWDSLIGGEVWRCFKWSAELPSGHCDECDTSYCADCMAENESACCTCDFAYCKDCVCDHACGRHL